MKESFYNLKIKETFERPLQNPEVLKEKMDTYDYKNEMILHGKKYHKHGLKTNEKLEKNILNTYDKGHIL